MSRFKAGDLALVIGGEWFLGQCVELKFWVNPGEPWYLDSQGIQHYLDPNADSGGWCVCDTEYAAVKRAEHLMPLRGDFAPEEVRDMEKDNA